MEEAIAGVFPLKWDRKSGYLIPKIMKKKMRRTWLGKKMMVMKDLVSFLRYKIYLRALELEISASHNTRIDKLKA